MNRVQLKGTPEVRGSSIVLPIGEHELEPIRPPFDSAQQHGYEWEGRMRPPADVRTYLLRYLMQAFLGKQIPQTRKIPSRWETSFPE